MNKTIRFAAGLLIPAFLLAGAVSGSALAADATVKVLLENEKVRVFETTYKPGDVNSAVATTASRVVRTIKGGKIQRTYADGKTENVVLKAGEARFLGAGPAYSVKNTGKTEIVSYTVQLK